ncbi:MAG: alpha/beta hydrolase, partial [Deltaproteobacteria bacterium]|nr:alpha/beta hydrolase [Deltaproteobacteria bacterium]
SHDIVLYGKSLGGAVATELALRHEPGALVLQSTFTSIPDMAQKLIPGVPKFLVPTKMDSLKKLPSIRCPVMVVHSQQDEIVPFSMGQSLARSATNLHAFAHYTGYGHNDLVMGKGEDIVSHIKALVGSFSR